MTKEKTMKRANEMKKQPRPATMEEAFSRLNSTTNKIGARLKYLKEIEELIGQQIYLIQEYNRLKLRVRDEMADFDADMEADEAADCA
jgi:predicted transcriptional regulator